MQNIMESPAEVKSELSADPQPLSLDWNTQEGPLPWETSVVDGLGNIVATCPRHDLALYIKETGNHFGDCRAELAAARRVLLRVIERKATLAEVVDMVTDLEGTIAKAGGAF